MNDTQAFVGDAASSEKPHIHPSAFIAEGAVVPASCRIGPFCTIGPHVVLDEGCSLISHVVLDGHLQLGAGVVVHPFAALGVSPQDLKYMGEPTACQIGAGTVIRESVAASTPRRNGRRRRHDARRPRMFADGVHPHRA